MRLASISASLSFTLAISVFVNGCRLYQVTSDTTSPLYDPNTEPRFDKRLVGTWLPESICMDLRKGPNNSYIANAGLFGGLPTGDSLTTPPIHLVKIGKYEYFFAAPAPGEPGTSLTDCCRVEFDDEKVFLRPLNLQAVTDDLEEHPGVLKHEWHPQTQPSGVVTEQPVGQPATRPTTSPVTQAASMPTTSSTAEERGFRNGHLQITDNPKAIRHYII